MNLPYTLPPAYRHTPGSITWLTSAPHPVSVPWRPASWCCHPTCHLPVTPLACTAPLTTLPEPPVARVPAPTPSTCCCPCPGEPGHLHDMMGFRGHRRPTPYGVGAVTAHSCPGRPHLLSAADIYSEVAWGDLGNLHIDLGQGSRCGCPFRLAF